MAQLADLEAKLKSSTAETRQQAQQVGNLQRDLRKASAELILQKNQGKSLRAASEENKMLKADVNFYKNKVPGGVVGRVHLHALGTWPRGTRIIPISLVTGHHPAAAGGASCGWRRHSIAEWDQSLHRDAEGWLGAAASSLQRHTGEVRSDAPVQRRLAPVSGINTNPSELAWCACRGTARHVADTAERQPHTPGQCNRPTPTPTPTQRQQGAPASQQPPLIIPATSPGTWRSLSPEAPGTPVAGALGRDVASPHPRTPHLRCAIGDIGAWVALALPGDLI